MAIVQDVCQADAARRRQAYVSAITTIMPMLAPSLGALMVVHFGWRSVHLVLAAAGLMLLIVVTGFVGETRRMELRRLTAGLGVQAAGQLLRQPAFARIVATNACSYAAIFSYIAGTPVVMMGPLRYSNYDYAALFAGTALALAAGAYSSAPLGRIVSGDAQRMVGPALATQAACAVLLLLPNPHDQVLQFCFIVPALLLGCFARGVAAPTMVYLAISANRLNSGLSAAVLGLAQLLCGALAGALVAELLPRYGYYAEIGTMATFSCLSVSLWVVTKRVPQPALSGPA